LDNEAGYAETYQNSKELVLAVLAGAHLLRGGIDHICAGSASSRTCSDGGEMLVITVLLWLVAIHFPARTPVDRS